VAPAKFTRKVAIKSRACNLLQSFWRCSNWSTRLELQLEFPFLAAARRSYKGRLVSLHLRPCRRRVRVPVPFLVQLNNILSLLKVLVILFQLFDSSPREVYMRTSPLVSIFATGFQCSTMHWPIPHLPLEKTITLHGQHARL